MNINSTKTCTYILEYMITEEHRFANLENDHIGMLSIYMIHGCPSTRTEVTKEAQQYWSFRDKVGVIDRIAIKGRTIIIPAFIQKEHWISCILTTWA